MRKNFVADIKPYILLMRPQHWIKNILVFAALVFSGQLFILRQLLFAICGFVIFCITASSIYIINDIADISDDKYNDSKRNRPVTSGIISINRAVVFAALLMLFAVVASFAINVKYGLVIITYLVINTIYTIGMKKIPIIEILSVSSGYILRVVSGAILAACPVSLWLMLCTACLSIFIVTEKRQGEQKEASFKGTTGRIVIKKYSKQLLKAVSFLFSALSVITYALYTVLFSVSIWMVITLPLVVCGILRYRSISRNSHISQIPEAAIYKDRPLFIIVLLWCVICITVIYFK